MFPVKSTTIVTDFLCLYFEELEQDKFTELEIEWGESYFHFDAILSEMSV